MKITLVNRRAGTRSNKYHFDPKTVSKSDLATDVSFVPGSVMNSPGHIGFFARIFQDGRCKPMKLVAQVLQKIKLNPV